jgi:glycosyltransferase involved in cell wall biosynthesis
MRILIVTHYLAEAHPHGLERVVAMLATHLVRGGDDVAVMTTTEHPVQASGRRAGRSLPGVAVYRLPAAALDPVGLPIDASESNRALDEVLDTWRPDVVHVTLLHGLDPHVVRRIQLRGMPVVLDVHSHEAGCPRGMLVTTTGDACAGPDGGRACVAACFANLPDAADRIGARARRFADAVHAADARTACSPYLSRWVRDTCGVAEPRALSPPIVSPPPSLPLHLRPTPATRGRLNLAVIGSVDRNKRPDVVVEAVAGARLGPTQLVILGAVYDHALEAAIRRRAAAVDNLELRIVGAFEPMELSLFLADVDVLVIPSHCAETYSLAAREAWSRGVPVFASRLGALTEAVREGENGFTFRHDDPQALGEQLQRVVAEPGLLHTLRAGAVRTPYVTVPQYAAAFREIYAEAIGAKPAISPPACAARQAKRSGGATPAAAIAVSQRARRPSDRASHSEVFTDIYARDCWRLGGESSSGPGSRRAHTEPLRTELPRLLSRLGIRSLLDLGCGDFNWMRETELGVDLYFGVDVVFDIVLANRLRYGGPRRRFLLRDLTRDPLPRADVVLCRDVLIHFPDDDLARALRAIIASGARYLLASTFIDREENEPIVLGAWHPVNLQLPPLSLPPPVDTLIETPSETGYDDKRLALWDLRSLRSL